MIHKIKKYFSAVDPYLAVGTLLLSLIGIVTIIGAVDNFGMSKLKMQIAMTVLGAVAAIVVANVDYHIILDKLWIPMLAFSIGILALTLIFGTSGVNLETTNKSWLNIPFINIMIQPSEFVKITFICTFSKHLSMVKDKINKPSTLAMLMLHAGSVIGMILISGDLGVALVYIAFVAIMLFCSGLSLWYLAGAAVILVIASPILWTMLDTYQQERILVGFNPALDPLGKGLQPLASKACIENGGVFGIGIFGKGRYESLAASHTDFMFATICEKFGIIGGIFCVALLATLIIRIVQIAMRSKDEGAFICIGVAAVIMVQTIENIGMCLAMIPVVGLTLPFLSCGGSSLLATFILVSLVHNVKAHTRKQYK